MRKSEQQDGDRVRSKYVATPLMRSANKRKIKRVLWALKAGTDPNCRDTSGQTALFYAARTRNNVRVIRLLLKHGAELSCRDRYGNSVLIEIPKNSLLSNYREVLRWVKRTQCGWLLDARNRRGDTALTNAAAWGSHTIVRELLLAGADKKLPDGVGCDAERLALVAKNMSVLRVLRSFGQI